MRRHDGARLWSPPQRAVVIAALTIAAGSLFLTTYTLALGDPVPHRIDAALVGNPTRHADTVETVQRVAEGSLAFQRYESVTAARHAIDLQRVYAALDLTSGEADPLARAAHQHRAHGGRDEDRDRRGPSPTSSPTPASRAS